MKVKFVYLFALLFLFASHISFGVVTAKCLVKYSYRSDTSKIIVDTLEVDFYSGAEINAAFIKVDEVLTEPVRSVFCFVWLDKSVNKYALAVLGGMELTEDDNIRINSAFVMAHQMVAGYDKRMTIYKITVLKITGDNTM
ncbi:MAG TPA: hypothetical protein VK806_00200 [Bacteroidia bacterium]|jgi:hypothetical protein|nr:hypothetical protein [Bacteroidia bacterium]